MSLEVLYDISTKEIRAWNADESVQGNLPPKPGQAVVILPTELPGFASDLYFVDLENQQVLGNPEYKPEPDWTDLYQAATTNTTKLSVIAQKLDLK